MGVFFNLLPRGERSLFSRLSQRGERLFFNLLPLGRENCLPSLPRGRDRGSSFSLPGQRYSSFHVPPTGERQLFSWFSHGERQTFSVPLPGERKSFILLPPTGENGTYFSSSKGRRRDKTGKTGSKTSGRSDSHAHSLRSQLLAISAATASPLRGLAVGRFDC